MCACTKPLGVLHIQRRLCTHIRTYINTFWSFLLQIRGMSSWSLYTEGLCTFRGTLQSPYTEDAFQRRLGLHTHICTFRLFSCRYQWRFISPYTEGALHTEREIVKPLGALQILMGLCETHPGYVHIYAYFSLFSKEME